MAAGGELSALMSLLLQLGTLERGQPMCLAALDPTDRAICLDLAYLGLLLPFWSAWHPVLPLQQSCCCACTWASAWCHRQGDECLSSSLEVCCCPSPADLGLPLPF